MPKRLKLDENKIIFLYLKYKSVPLVAKEFNCHYNTVYDRLRKNKINLFPYGSYNKNKRAWNKGLTKKTDERIRKYASSEGGKRTQFKKNQVPWCSGLKKENSEWAKRQSQRMEKNNPMNDKNNREKISKARKGNKYPNLSNTLKRLFKEGKLQPPMKGKRFPKELYPNWGLRGSRKNIVIPLKDTKIELKIQNFLKQMGIEFFTHQYIKEIEHGYQCDILIPSMNLVIECDGNYWHKYPIGNELDHIRTKELIEKGFGVLRLWEFEINKMTIEEFKRKLTLIMN